MSIANVIINLTTPYIRTSLMQLPDTPERDRAFAALRTLTETLGEYEQIVSRFTSEQESES